MTTQTSYVTDQVTEGINLIQKHKQAILNVFGMAGTGFSDSSGSFESRVQKLQSSLKVNDEQAKLILAIWPVYEMGYKDALRSNS